MERYAEQLEFEQAAVVRDQIAALSTVLSRQAVEEVAGARHRHSGGRSRGRACLCPTSPWCGAGATWAIGPISRPMPRRRR